MKNSERILTEIIFDQIVVEKGIEHPKTEVVIRIGNGIFAVKGDLSCVTGKPKAGKTATAIFLLYTALRKNLKGQINTLQISTEQMEGIVIYIDTEQPRSYTYKFAEKINQLLQVNKTPENLKILNWRKYEAEELGRKLESLIDNLRNIELIIIDGIADFVSDTNDAKACNQIVQKLMYYAEKLDAPIVVFLHENPGSNKMRGHLGSQLERKCGATMAIKKDRVKQIHIIESIMMRGSEDFKPIFARYDETLGVLQEISTEESKSFLEETNKVLITKKKEELAKLAQKILVSPTSYTELKNLLAQNDITEASAKKKIIEMINFGIIQKTKDKLYVFASKVID